MKTHPFLLALILISLVTTAAAEVIGGPQGGRLLPSSPQPIEFHVTSDQHVELTFYTADLQPSPAGEAQVTLIAEPVTGRTTVALESTAHGFRSTAPLPPGAPYRLVVQVRAAPGERPQNFRLDLDLHTCGECQRAEYACTCEGH